MILVTSLGPYWVKHGSAITDLFDPAAALPHEVLEKDFYVPGCCSRSDAYRGSKMISEIMTLTNDTVLAFFQRTTQDHCFNCFGWGTLFVLNLMFLAFHFFALSLARIS